MTRWRERTCQIWPDINCSISVANTTKKPRCQVAGIDAIWRKIKAQTGLRSGTASSVRVPGMRNDRIHAACSLKQRCCILAVK